MLNSAEVEETDCIGLKLFPDHSFMKMFLKASGQELLWTSDTLLHADTD